MIRELEKERWDAQARAEPGLRKVINRGWSEEDREELHRIETEILSASVEWENKFVLDVGAGIGRLSKEFLDFGAREVTLMDISSEMLEIAAKNLAVYRKSTDTVCQDVLEPWNVNYYDIIFSAHLTVHILNGDNVVKIYEEAAKHLSQAGKLIFIHEVADIPWNVDYCAIRTRDFYRICAERSRFTTDAEHEIEFNNCNYFIQILSVSEGMVSK